MSDDLPPRPRSNGMPTFVWLLLGVLVVALFVLLLGSLSPYL
jgi:hypothetical protein